MKRQSTVKIASTFSTRRSAPRARARTDEQKREVRENLIATGRLLYQAGGPEAVSLRKIAGQTGYSPATVYKYFRGQHELFIAIREDDLSRLAANLETVARNIEDPEECLRAVSLAAVAYWMRNPAQFCFLFTFHPAQGSRPSASVPDTPITLLRSYGLYSRLIEVLFLSYEHTPSCTPRSATETIIAATHGIISFAMHTGSLEWTTPTRMAEEVLDALLLKWRSRLN